MGRSSGDPPHIPTLALHGWDFASTTQSPSPDQGQRAIAGSGHCPCGVTRSYSEWLCKIDFEAITGLREVESFASCCALRCYALLRLFSRASGCQGKHLSFSAGKGDGTELMCQASGAVAALATDQVPAKCVPLQGHAEHQTRAQVARQRPESVLQIEVIRSHIRHREVCARLGLGLISEIEPVDVLREAIHDRIGQGPVLESSCATHRREPVRRAAWICDRSGCGVGCGCAAACRGPGFVDSQVHVSDEISALSG